MNSEERRNLRGVWREMFLRCYIPWHPAYAGYGQRGIRVCEEWRDFERFIEEMGDRPEGTSIDRINNDGPYAQWNCRWSTAAEQARNRRPPMGKIEVNGRLVTFQEAGRLTGINPDTIRARVRWGWSQEKAISAPVRPNWANRRRNE